MNSKASQIKRPSATFHWNFIFPLLILFALSFLGPCRRSVQNQPARWASESKRLLQESRYAEAREYSQKLLRLFPRNHIYLDQAAEIEIHLQHPAEAALDLERFIQVSPNPSEACPRLQQSYQQMGETEKMLDAAQRCLAMEPGNSDFIFQYALALEKAGQLEKAQSFYADGKKQFPSYTDYAVGLARIHLRQGNLPSAWDEIQKVLVEHPHFADAQWVASQVLIQQGSWPQAQSLLQQAVKEHPLNSDLQEAWQQVTRHQGGER